MSDEKKPQKKVKAVPSDLLKRKLEAKDDKKKLESLKKESKLPEKQGKKSGTKAVLSANLQSKLNSNQKRQKLKRVTLNAQGTKSVGKPPKSNGGNLKNKVLTSKSLAKVKVAPAKPTPTPTPLVKPEKPTPEKPTPEKP
jgi:hypothetical protein